MFDPSQIEIALIESDGQLRYKKNRSIRILPAKISLFKSQNQTPAGNLAGTEIIIDGKLIEKGLAKSGLTLEQFKIQLNNSGVSDWREVTLAMITPEGELYIDRRDNTR